ncbi:DUF192 domain-containing protein [Alphaproteobacteria bacterium]|nr:DUF192 domain-containing protein [Alphaproteobacteria bacterium]
MSRPAFQHWSTVQAARRAQRFALILALFCAGCVFWAGCAGADNTTNQLDVPPAFETSDITLLPGGDRPPVTFTVKLAKSEAQRRYGLMFTPDLPDRHGMLFIFEADAVLRFWMKNTQILLDMLFFDSAGHLVSLIRSAEPFSLTPRASTGLARYVLEINGGDAAKMGVQPDARLLLP